MGRMRGLVLLACVHVLAIVRAAEPVVGGTSDSPAAASASPPGHRIARLPPVTNELPLPAGSARLHISSDPESVALPEAAEPAETLQAAWALALVTDQQLMANTARVESSVSALNAACAERLPLLGVSADYVVRDNEKSFRIDSPLLPFSFTSPYLPRDNAAFEGRVDVPIYTGGRVTSDIDAAQCNVRAMERRMDRYRLDLKMRVAEDFVAVLRAEQELSVADSHERSLAAHAHDIELLHQQQRVPLNDLLAAQVALADAQHQTIKAQSDLDACRAAYNRRLGRPLTAPVQLAAMAVDPVELDVDAQTQQALTQRPELAELDAQAAEYRHRAESAAAAKRAQVHVQGAYTFEENDYQTPEGITSAGVGVWWNLHDGGRTRNRVCEQTNQAQALAHLRAEAQSLIQLEVRQAWLAVQETRNRLAVTQQSIQRAEENLRVTRERYGTGMATNTDVLNAESLRVQTYRNHNNAVYDAALAGLRLQRATGGL